MSFCLHDSVFETRFVELPDLFWYEAFGFTQQREEALKLWSRVDMKDCHLGTIFLPS